MKKTISILGAMSFAFFALSSCGGNNSSEAPKNIDSLTSSIITPVLKDTIDKTTGDTKKVSCSEVEEKNEDGGDPYIIKTCIFKTYKTVMTGSPDYKGRYIYESELYKNINGEFEKISNSQLFKQNQNKLLSIINQSIQEDYKIMSSDPETKDCFDGKQFEEFTIEQLRIEFDDNKIYFSVYFDLSNPNACMSVGGTDVSFTLDEIQPYLNE